MSPLSIGDTLRAARRRQGHSLAEVAASTRVRESHLAALESDEFGVLGGDVYARGFITAYARFLGLDPVPLLDVHRGLRDIQGDGGQRRRKPPAAKPARPDLWSARAAVVLMLVAVVVAALVFAGFSDSAEAAQLGARAATSL